MRPPPHHPRGRGAAANPASRFETRETEPDRALWDDEGLPSSPATEILPDASRVILARNDSPDVGFDVSVNPYRGCEHGCVYCYARPTHEYFGLSAGLDFETRIFVKREAPALLREALMKASWRPEPIALSGVTDCYQPIEREMRLTRGCLEVLAEFRNPALIITKSALVVRDLDVLRDMAAWGGIHVSLSVTTLRPDLHAKMEPRASSPGRRLAAIKALAEVGVPVGVLLGPVIPALNEEEIPAILKAAAEAGATSARFIALRLPHGVKDLFAEWLAAHFPDRAAKVLNRVRSLHGGALYDSTHGHRMRGAGAHADQIAELFRIGCLRAGLDHGLNPTALSTDHFRRPGPAQLSLFGGS